MSKNVQIQFQIKLFNNPGIKSNNIQSGHLDGFFAGAKGHFASNSVKQEQFGKRAVFEKKMLRQSLVEVKMDRSSPICKKKLSTIAK